MGLQQFKQKIILLNNAFTINGVTITLVEYIKKTPLYDVHDDLCAKIIEFYGYLMPLQYDSIINEHQNVRKNAGVFDISHMGVFFVEGKDATKLVQQVITNDVGNIPNSDVIYTPICNYKGGIVDDILVYKYNSEKYMLVVNCSNIDKDFHWINRFKTDDTVIKDSSDEIAILAVQGPKSKRIIRDVFGEECSSLLYFQFMEIVKNEIHYTVSRTGYTGEVGFEIFVDGPNCVGLWNELLEKGQDKDLKPVGLGARNTLRLEAGYLLYGNDIDGTISPLEANIGWAVKFKKGDFIGRDELLKQSKEGINKKLIGFKMIDKGIPREECKITHHKFNIGDVTSGTFSPNLNRGIGLGYVNKSYSGPNRRIDINIRGINYPAITVTTPFVSKLKKGS